VIRGGFPFGSLGCFVDSLGNFAGLDDCFAGFGDSRRGSIGFGRL